MFSNDHSRGKCFTKKLGHSNNYEEKKVVIVRHHDVRDVLEDNHHCSIAALSQELEETLRHKLRSH